MTLGRYHSLRGWMIPANNDSYVEGYLVEYEELKLKGFLDNLDWLPKETYFNGGIKMNFGLALEEVKRGHGMRLPNWQPDVVVRAQFPDEHSKMTAPYLYVESRFGRVPWKETMIELFAENWEVVS